MSVPISQFIPPRLVTINLFSTSVTVSFRNKLPK